MDPNESQLELDIEYEEDVSGSVISDHYIRDSIRSCYSHKILIPLFVLIVFLMLWVFFPMHDVLFPTAIKQGDSLSRVRKDTDSVTVTLDEAYFTGYTSTLFNRPNGYYYYAMWKDHCVIIKLSPATCEEGLSYIKNLTIHANIKKHSSQHDQLLFNLSNDLGWTTDGMLDEMEEYILDEQSVNGASTTLFFIVYFAAFLYTLIYVIICGVSIINPLLSHPVLSLGRFGNAKKLLLKAEEELSTLPQLATEDMFITETFFIEISQNGVAIVPISEIVWIYKHSTLHKFLWYHFVISYTLHITGNKHFYMQCPKNIKSNIDGIMDYLAEANHDILVGFSEENRLKVAKLQNKPFHFKTLTRFLTKHIK